MGFRGHLISGLATGVLVAEGAAGLGRLGTTDYYAVWGGIVATATFAALFPDLDTASVVQRWFYRLVLAALAYLAIEARYGLATGVAIVSLLPLLDHHRGWTHARLAPLAVPLILALIHALAGSRGMLAVPNMLRRDALYIVAAVCGWYVHLLLDGLFPRISAPNGHR